MLNQAFNTFQTEILLLHLLAPNMNDLPNNLHWIYPIKTLKGAILKWRALRGREGGWSKRDNISDRLREWDSDKGDGVQKSENFADVI